MWLVKFHEKMRRICIEKVKQIERNLKYLEQEQSTQKSVEKGKKIHEKFSRVADFCILRISECPGEIPEGNDRQFRLNTVSKMIPG
jgi:hypothetical protein